MRKGKEVEGDVANESMEEKNAPGWLCGGGWCGGVWCGGGGVVYFGREELHSRQLLQFGLVFATIASFDLLLARCALEY